LARSLGETINKTKRQIFMFKSIAALAVLVVVAGCNGPINSNCAGLGALGGGLFGAVTNNNLAESAIAGGVLGAVAADQGMCR
jgi:hypothetical protein